MTHNERLTTAWEHYLQLRTMAGEEWASPAYRERLLALGGVPAEERGKDAPEGERQRAVTKKSQP